MLKYALKRIIMAPFLLLLVALLVFLLLNLSHSDPLPNLLPAEYTEEQYLALQKELGLDKPLLVQYGTWVINALHGDFGTSYKTRGPVWDEIGYRIPTSLTLAFLSTLIMVAVGLPLGVMCAVKKYTAFDGIVNVLAKFAGAIPGFWLGLVLIMEFAMKRKLFPIYGMNAGVKSWVLPVITLVLPYIANYMRQVRSSMLDCIQKDYVRTARSKGSKESRVIFHEALKNALLPIITMTGSVFANLIGGAVVGEKLFAIPGIGSKIVESINNRDIPTMIACTMVLAIITILMQLIIDLSYALVDPRIRGTFAGKKKRRSGAAKAGEVAQNVK